MFGLFFWCACIPSPGFSFFYFLSFNSFLRNETHPYGISPQQPVHRKSQRKATCIKFIKLKEQALAVTQTQPGPCRLPGRAFATNLPNGSGFATTPTGLPAVFSAVQYSEPAHNGSVIFGYTLHPATLQVAAEPQNRMVLAKTVENCPVS